MATKLRQATYIDPRPIWEQRAAKDLSTPLWDEKLKYWANMSIPQAGIYAEKGGYTPFKIADQAHQHPALTIVVTGGIRSSKSIGLSAEVVAWAPHSDLIWLAGDTYDLARQEFEYAMEALLSLEWTKRAYVTLPRSKYMPCSMETIWGTLIETRSLNDVNTFVARAPDFIGLCEPGLASPDSVQKARERLSTRAGRLWAAGTFEEARFNWLEEYWRAGVRWPNPESIKSFTLPTWVNRISFPGGRNDAGIHLLRNSCRSFEEFLLRCGGVPIPHRSQVIGESWNEKNNVTPLMFQRSDNHGNLTPVELAIDPGYGGGSHYVVLAIQKEKCPLCSSERLLIIDEIATESTVYQKVIEKARTREWWLSCRTGVPDPNASRHHVFGMPSVQTVWWEEARVNLRIPPKHLVEELVGLIKDTLSDPVQKHPHVLVDPKCQRLIWEMTNWRRRKQSEGYGKPSDQNCDAVKALGYYISDWWPTRFGDERPGYEDAIKVSEVTFT